MKPTITSSSSGDGFEKLKKQLAALARKQVYVGVPEDETNRSGGEMTNAALLYLHTNGSALQGIPARPVIEPAISAADNKERITRQLADAGRAVLAEKPAQARQALDNAGVVGSNAAKRWFTESRNGWAPNTPHTIAEKGSEKPLIDTAQMRRSITYVVDEE